MSMRNYSIYGYGVERPHLSNEVLCALLLGHADTLAMVSRNQESFDELMYACRNQEDITEAAENMESHTGEYGIYGIISDIMLQETGVFFDYLQGEYSNALMLCACMPWEIQKAERKLTREAMDKLFEKYLPNNKADYIELEFYG